MTKSLLAAAVAALCLTACFFSKPGPNDIVVPRADLQALTNQYNAALAGDPELSPVFGAFKPTGTKKPDTESFGVLAIKGKAWTGLGPDQRDRVVKKAASTFTDLFLQSRIKTVKTATIHLVGDGKYDVGWFDVRKEKGDYSYRFVGQ